MSPDAAEVQLQVVGAAILREGRCFAARRSAAMSTPLKWELPGGKPEPGEAPQAALAREIAEELGLQIEVHDLLGVGTALARPGLRIHLAVYRASWRGGDLVLHEHDQSGWFTAEELMQLDWAAPDIPVLPAVVALMAPGGA